MPEGAQCEAPAEVRPRPAQRAERGGGGVARAADLRHPDIPAEECFWRGHGELELQSVEDRSFHREDLVAMVRVVRDVHELVHTRRVYLLELGGEQHARHADELKLAPSNRNVPEEAVYVVDRQVQRFRFETVLLRNL
eukprot:scaffold1156_cov131-Isochrysis_galbana.AAC.6